MTICRYGVGIALFHAGGAAAYHIKPMLLAGVTVGALIFGAGMALLGYCPGTGVAAAATGRIHAMVGFVGMIAGGILYAFVYPGLQDGFLKAGEYGKLRLTDITSLPEVAWWVILTVVALAAFSFLPKSPKSAEAKGPS